MTKLKKLPAFKSVAAEQEFWVNHDSTEFLDWQRAQNAVLPNLRPTTQSISLRLPTHVLERLKAAAHSRDVPYQSLIKIWLEEKLGAL